jgi:hypothetical protein
VKRREPRHAKIEDAHRVGRRHVRAPVVPRVTPKPATPAPHAWRRHLGYAVLALFFAFADLRLIIVLMPKAFLNSASVSEGVVHGEPMWRVYQSRVLGPYIVDALSAFTSPGIGFAWFALAVLFATGYAILAFTDRLRDRARPPVPSFLLFQLAVIFLLPCLWIYPWDLISLLLFTVFNYLVLRGASRARFVWLYVVAIFNHEIGLLIAGWLALDPVVRFAATRESKGTRRHFEWAQSLTGLGLMAAGLVVIEALRKSLLIRETQGPQDLPSQVLYGRSFHFSLPQNWDTAVTFFTLSVPEGFAFLVPLFLLVAVVLAIRLARSDWTRCAALSAVLLGMVTSFLCFGLVFETRVLLPLVPFVAMNAWAVFGGRTRSA